MMNHDEFGSNLTCSTRPAGGRGRIPSPLPDFRNSSKMAANIDATLSVPSPEGTDSFASIFARFEVLVTEVELMVA